MTIEIETDRAKRYWTICFPGEEGQTVVETWSEEQILKSAYYRYWVYRMTEANKHSEISDENCIEDWKTVHWAVRTDQFGRKTFGDCDCGCNEPMARDPKSMLEFLANRLEYAGTSDEVARTYARDIRYVLETCYE